MKPEFDLIEAVCEGFEERVKALGLKGPAKTADAAIHYAVGFAKGLQTVGYDISTLTLWVAYDLALHGYRAVQKVLAERTPK